MLFTKEGLLWASDGSGEGRVGFTGEGVPRSKMLNRADSHLPRVTSETQQAPGLSEMPLLSLDHSHNPS